MFDLRFDWNVLLLAVTCRVIGNISGLPDVQRSVTTRQTGLAVLRRRCTSPRSPVVVDCAATGFIIELVTIVGLLLFLLGVVYV